MSCFSDCIPSTLTLGCAFSFALVALSTSTGHTVNMQYILIDLNISQNLEQERGKAVFEKVIYSGHIHYL